MGNLYIVATPIGNLEDITLRALRVLGEVELIAAEDTRVTRRLLSHYNIHTRLTSFREQNQVRVIPELLAAMESTDVALVSDAGTPGVNDPGQALVNAAANAGIPVVTVPGPSAVTSAIAISGLVDEAFLYLGFVPRKRGERTRLLETLRHEQRAVVALESPHRLRHLLQGILETLGDRRIAVCREMTKLHEEVFRGKVSDALAYFEQPKGEFTLVLGGSTLIEALDSDVEDLAWSLLDEMRSAGEGARHAVSHTTAVTGLPRRQVYRMWLAGADEANETRS